MKMSFLKTFLGLGLAVVMTSAFGQVKSLGTGKSVTAKTIDSTKFVPQINPGPLRGSVEKVHKMKFEFPQGTTNNLIPGGTIPGSRIYSELGTFFPAMGNTGSEPPDPDLAVSTSHIVEVVNSSIAFYTKAGVKTFEQTGQSFFQSIAPEAFDFDPKVIYDQIAQRFIVLDLGLNDATSGTSSLLIAVSANANPNGTWKLFKVDVKQTSGSNNFWLDYPGFGYNKDMIAVTGNMFAMTGSSGFNGVQIICFDKATLYGGTATPVKFQVADGFTLQLAKTLDPTSPSLYGVETGNATSHRITAITKTGSTFTVNQASVAVPAWVRDQGFITGPSGVQVQTNDPRMLVASSRNGRLLVSHSVAVSSSDRRPAARWYDFKINNWPTSGTPTLAQAGQLDPPAGHGYSFPAICQDSAGSYGMTFSMIGTTTPGKVMAAGRKAGDIIGTMSNPIVLENSTNATYNGFSSRWGDYFDLELDPSDNKSFWAVGMGAGQNGRWQTFIKSFKVSPADVDLTKVFAAGISPVAGSITSGDKNSLNVADGNNLNMQSVAVKGLGQAAGFNAAYVIPFANIDTLRFFAKVNGPNGASVTISFRNKNTGVFDQMTTVGLTGTATVKTIDLSASQIATYVNSNGQMAVILRAVNPIKGGAMPAPFTFQTDQASFGATPTT